MASYVLLQYNRYTCQLCRHVAFSSSSLPLVLIAHVQLNLVKKISQRSTLKDVTKYSENQNQKNQKNTQFQYKTKNELGKLDAFIGNIKDTKSKKKNSSQKKKGKDFVRYSDSKLSKHPIIIPSLDNQMCDDTNRITNENKNIETQISIDEIHLTKQKFENIKLPRKDMRNKAGNIQSKMEKRTINQKAPPTLNDNKCGNNKRGSSRVRPSKSETVMIGKAEESFLQEMMTSGEQKRTLDVIEEHARNGKHSPFVYLRQLCGWACVQGSRDDINRIKVLASKMHPKHYKEHMSFDTYLASALHYDGKHAEGLEIITRLYATNPKKYKKVKDAATFTIKNMMKSGEEQQEQLALAFVRTLAKEQKQLAPALVFWQVGFSSPSHHHHKMTEELLQEYPDMIEMLPRKIISMTEQAIATGDKDMLYRLLQLLLQHNFSEFYTLVTSAILQCQCDEDDLNGADETIKFARTMGIQLNLSIIQRFLNLLNQHKKPVTSTIMSLKYGKWPPKPTPPLPPPPKFEYKF